MPRAHESVGSWVRYKIHPLIQSDAACELASSQAAIRSACRIGQTYQPLRTVKECDRPKNSAADADQLQEVRRRRDTDPPVHCPDSNAACADWRQ
jgi:hypothetical protein